MLVRTCFRGGIERPKSSTQSGLDVVQGGPSDAAQQVYMHAIEWRTMHLVSQQGLLDLVGRQQNPTLQFCQGSKTSCVLLMLHLLYSNMRKSHKQYLNLRSNQHFNIPSFKIIVLIPKQYPPSIMALNHIMKVRIAKCHVV